MGTNINTGERPDHISANLPSRDFARTETFYHALGFGTLFRDETWMILTWQEQLVEFFPYPDLKPKESWFSASLRSDNISALHEIWAKCNHWPASAETPRLTEIMPGKGPIPAMFAMIDPDGSLWRIMEQKESR